jgi:hypothetical protein
MLATPHRSGWLVLAAVALTFGCTPIRPPSGKSPLLPAQMSPDSVVLDIFFVRFPLGDPEINGPFWSEIDEQHFPAELRRKLLENGFRAGLVGDRLPEKLAQLLELSDRPIGNVLEQKRQLNEVNVEPRVVQRHLQLRAHQRSEIVASEVYPELPVFTCESGLVSGRSYPNAHGILATKFQPRAGNRVWLELVPELQYGEVQQRYVNSCGVVRVEAGQPRHTFDDLTMAATLAPGNMIVVSGLPDRPGSIGYHFFTHETSGKLQQTLMLLRLSQTQHDDLFQAETAEAGSPATDKK